METQCDINNHLFAALQHVIDNIKKSKDVSESDLTSLLWLCTDDVVPALSICDAKCTTKNVAPSGREVYHVVGSRGNKYTCLKDEFFCNCKSFTNFVIIKGNKFICKHVLAVLISDALGECDVVLRREDVLVSFLKQILPT